MCKEQNAQSKLENSEALVEVCGRRMWQGCQKREEYHSGLFVNVCIVITASPASTIVQRPAIGKAEGVEVKVSMAYSWSYWGY